jgi:hypothetical protein
MEKPIKIMHIDGDYPVVYILIREGVFIKSTVSLRNKYTGSFTSENINLLRNANR